MYSSGEKKLSLPAYLWHFFAFRRVLFVNLCMWTCAYVAMWQLICHWWHLWCACCQLGWTFWMHAGHSLSMLWYTSIVVTVMLAVVLYESMLIITTNYVVILCDYEWWWWWWSVAKCIADYDWKCAEVVVVCGLCGRCGLLPLMSSPSSQCTS